MTAANRITGSASMKIGIVPDVSVTMVDEKDSLGILDSKSIIISG